MLGPGWPGILLHEAVGHGLEGDFNRKKTSAFAGRLGQQVASELVTVVDDGTIPNRRGSLNVDDEGTPTRRNVLIENGVLRGYMQDRLNARLMGMEPTGNGRRESYAHPPMPRMTNTFMLAGQDDPADIIRSVARGLYAVNFGGGQVDITNGKFVFSASEAYLIEDGKVTAPVKGATLIGNGPEALTRVTRVGHDLSPRRGRGHLRQGRPVGAGGRGAAHHPDRRHHRRRHPGRDGRPARPRSRDVARRRRARSAAPPRPMRFLVEDAVLFGRGAARAGGDESSTRASSTCRSASSSATRWPRRRPPTSRATRSSGSWTRPSRSPGSPARTSCQGCRTPASWRAACRIST